MPPLYLFPPLFVFPPLHISANSCNARSKSLTRLEEIPRLANTTKSSLRESPLQTGFECVSADPCNADSRPVESVIKRELALTSIHVRARRKKCKNAPPSAYTRALIGSCTAHCCHMHAPCTLVEHCRQQIRPRRNHPIGACPWPENTTNTDQVHTGTLSVDRSHKKTGESVQLSLEQKTGEGAQLRHESSVVIINSLAPVITDKRQRRKRKLTQLQHWSRTKERRDEIQFVAIRNHMPNTNKSAPHLSLCPHHTPTQASAHTHSHLQAGMT